MYIKEAIIQNYRNIAKMQLADLEMGVHFLVGKNAQGKTNLIEALNYLSCGRSFRGVSEEALIKEGCDSSLLFARYHTSHYQGKIEAALYRNRQKSVCVDGVPIRRMSEMIGKIHTVVFAPEDIRTLKDSPRLRRRMVDIELSKIRPAYYTCLQKYMEVVNSKNQLLKKREKDVALIEVYNEQLTQYACEIIRRRRWFTQRVAAYAREIHAFLTENQENLNFVYRGTASSPDIADEFQEKLKKSLQKEMIFEMSLIGPHREDWTIFIDGKGVKQRASQGQQRTAMLALKLAFAHLAEEERGEAPVLLLDDVFSELDETRRERLLHKMKRNQVFITATDVEVSHAMTGVKKIRVSEGRIF